MASKAVMDAVAARVAANWTRATVFTSNLEAEVPSDLSPFLVIEYPIGNEGQITIGATGSNIFREMGAIRFVLCVRAGSGLDPWTQYVDELRALFRAKQFEGVNTWAADPPVINDQSDVAGYFELAFAVPYYFDITG